MKKMPLLVTIVMMLFSSQAFAADVMTYTLKNGGFENSSIYFIDVYTNTGPGGDSTQFELGETSLTIIFNDAGLSNPLISDADTALQSSYTVGLDPAGLGAGFIQLQISPDGAPDFMVTEDETWLVRIGFTIDPTAACSGESAGIGWDGNPFHHTSGSAFLFFNGSDDSPLASAPTIDGTPSISIAAGNPYGFTPNAVDGCGALAFAIVNQPSWADFDPATGELSGTPVLADVGTTSDIVIRVTDQNSNWNELTPFDIEVTAGCEAPVISGSPATLIEAGTTYSFIPTVSNGCGILTYSIVNQPSWAGFDPATGELSGTPAESDTGVTSGIEITVTDELDAGSTLAAFDLQVPAADLVGSDSGSGGSTGGSSGGSAGGSGSSSGSGSSGGGGGGGCFISTIR